jgi:hypothetical protein
VNTAARPAATALLANDVAHLREVLYLELHARDLALQIQAKEYERRLESLNHENARILAAGEKSVTSEKFDGFAAAHADWKRVVERWMATSEGQAASALGREKNVRPTLIVVIGAATLLLSLVASVFAVLK